MAARDAFAAWFATAFGVPCFLYGPGRTLPEVRRGAFTALAPDTGPAAPHPTAGATAVGARDVLIAYNVWIRAVDASADRPTTTWWPWPSDSPDRSGGPGCAPSGWPSTVAPRSVATSSTRRRVALTDVYDAVAAGAAAGGCTVSRGELVGLLPRSALSAVPESRWQALGLRAEDTIEHRLGTRRG